MVNREDSPEYRLLLIAEEHLEKTREPLRRMEAYARELRRLLFGEDEQRTEAIQVLCQLGYSTKQAQQAVEYIPPGLSTQEIIKEVFRRSTGDEAPVTVPPQEKVSDEGSGGEASKKG